MRLFVALRPPFEAVAHLAAAAAGVPTTRTDQWHVTLAFLGELEGPEPLREPLARAAAGSPPLRLRLSGASTFGSGVLAAGLAGDVEGLRRLAAAVRSACRAAGVDLPRGRYRPHLTVARRQPVPPALAGYEGPPWTATELELVRSRLGAQVEHQVVRRHRLGVSGGPAGA